MKVIGFLQNAWSPYYAGGFWPRESWLKALWRSRSGKRLKILIESCPNIEFWIDNTTPIVGATPDSVVKPDMDHIQNVIHSQAPNVIITFGNQAFCSLKDISKVPVLNLPHPAYRLVTDDLYIKAGELLRNGIDKNITIKQEKNSLLLIK